MDVVIYHNPDCGKLCDALAIIEVPGYTPTLIEYCKTGLDPATIAGPPCSGRPDP